MNLDELYQQALQAQIGSVTAVTNLVPKSIYEGEHAFAMMLKCFRVDGFGLKGDIYTYCLHIEGLERPTLMRIIISLKDVMKPPLLYIPKIRSKVYKELQSLGMAFMAQYVTSKKNDTFTLHISRMSYKVGLSVCRILFGF